MSTVLTLRGLEGVEIVLQPLRVAIEGGAVVAEGGAPFATAPLAAAAATLVLPGDSCPKPLPTPRPNPYAGIYRFAERISAVVDGASAVPAVGLPSEAIDLAHNVTPTEVDRTQLIALRDMVDKIPVLNAQQREQLKELIEQAMLGVVPMQRIAELIIDALLQDMVEAARAVGAQVVAKTDQGRLYYEVTYDSTNPEHRELMSPLWSILFSIQTRVSGGPALARILSKEACTLIVPSLGYLVLHYGDYLKNVQFFVDDLTGDDIADNHAQGKTHVQLIVDTLEKHVADFKKKIRAYAATLHDFFHAIDWNTMPEECRQLVLELRAIVKSVADEHGMRQELHKALDYLVDVALEKVTAEGIKIFLNALILTAVANAIADQNISYIRALRQLVERLRPYNTESD